MIQLELPNKLRNIQDVIKGVATHMIRPISRKYDVNEHTVAEELQVLADGRAEVDSSPKKKKKDQPVLK